jgi:murein DD-endopeptidase MepM/ murein hydrolase activator NlpD
VASTQATIDLVVRGSSAVNKLIQNVGQLQGAIDRINSQTLDLAAPGLQRRANSLSATMAGASARANDLGRDRAQILSDQRQAVERLTQAQLRQQQAIERTASAERELSRLASRDELSSRRTDRLKDSLRESAAEAERLGDEMNAASAAVRTLESRLGAIRSAGRRSIAAAGELIDVNSTLAASNAVNALADQYNRYGDSLRRSARESKLVGTVLPGQINNFNQFRNQIEQTEASLASLRGELRQLGAMEATIDMPSRPVGRAELLTPMSPAELGRVQAAQQENSLRQQRNARRTELAGEISAQESNLAILERRTETVGRNIVRNQEAAARLIANRDPANTAGLAISLNQIQAQAESLALVANNSKVASTAFNRFTVAAEMASIKLARAQQNTFTALAAGFSGGGGVNIPSGLRQEADIAGTRNMVGQLISDIPNLTRSEGALSAHIQLLSQIRTILPFLSLEYRAVEEAIAGLSEELEGAGLRGQTSKIDPGAGQRLLKQREREEKATQKRAVAIDKIYQDQLGLTDRIASSKLSVADKEDLSLRLNYALDALGESQLENAAAMTRQIADQLKLKEKLAKLSPRGQGEQKVFGALGTSFMPISGQMPSGERIAGSPVAKDAALRARLSWQTALSQMEDVSKQIKSLATTQGAKVQMNWNLAFEKARDIVADATLAGLQDGTKAAVALGQQRSKEQERAVADAWKLSGGPAMPPWMQSNQKVFGALGTSFMPISGNMPKGRSQLQAEETQKATREIAAQQIVLNKLQKQYMLEEGKGVKFLEEKTQLNGTLDMLMRGQVGSSRANSVALGQNIKFFRDALSLRILEAKVAGTYQSGSATGGGKRATTAEQLEDRRTKLLERALGVQGTAIALEARGAQISQEKQEIEATILRLKELQGQASEDELKILLKQIQNLKIVSKEISNALPPTQKSSTTDKTPFLERLTGSPRASAAISEGLIGGAFPLLFGQGIGASAGGLIGGAAGGFAGGGLGFGLSLIGTALGTSFDTLSQAAQDTGKALNYPIEGFDKLKEAGLFASRQQEYYISKLIETGQTARATAEIQAEIIKKIGVSGVNDLMELGDASSRLSKTWAEFNLQLQAALAGPMAGLLEWVTSILELNNQSFRSEQLAKDVSAGLSGNTKDQFDREIAKIDLSEQVGSNVGPLFGGLSKGEAAKQRTALAEFYKPLAKLPTAKAGKLTPEQEEARLNKSIENADKSRAIIQQGVALERSGVDLRLSIEDTVYGLRKRATDMEREAAEFRRSIEDEVFGKRQELEQKLAENERKRQQNAIDTFDLQLQKASVGLDPIAQGVVDAAREYLKVRAEGEADLQLAEKQLKLELQGIDQEVSRYKLQVEDRVSQMAIQRDEFSRDVSRARLQIERQIGDYVVGIEEYRLAMAKHRYEVEIDLEKKKQITAQEGLAVQAKGGYTGTSVDGFPITSRPGMRWGKMHAGVDIAAPTGTALGYEMGGKVLSAGWIAGYGNTLKVALDNGMTVLSGHLDEIFVKVGQRFEANQRLAAVGSTGRSTGPHTHQESWMNGKADPYASLPFLQLGKAVSSKADPDIYLQEGVGYFSRKTGRMVRGLAGGTGQAASAGAAAQVSSGAVGAAPVAPGAPAMPALPTAPQLVGINDLMQQYLGIIEKIKAATVGATTIEKQRFAVQSEAARFALEQQVLAPILQYKEQNRELEFEIQKRKERNRLAFEGVAPELIEGEMRVLEIERDLNSVLTGLEATTNQAVRAELERLKLNPKLVDGTFRLTEATLAHLIATTEDVGKQEELRKKLQAILDLRNQLANKAKGEAGGAAKGARDAAEGEIISPREKVEGRIGDLKKELTDLIDPANQVIAAADAIGGAFSESFRGVISGSMSAQEALANFFQRTADYFLDMAAQIIQKWIVMTILNQALKLFPGGGLGTAVSPEAAAIGQGSPIFAAANGAYFDKSITPFAMGGAFTNSIVSGPTLFKFAAGGVMNTGVMGEAGPEAIMPLSKGPGGRLGVDASGAGGGDISVTVNVDAKGTGVEGNQQQGAALGRVISAAVQAEIVKQQRPGGLLTR